MIVLKVYRRGVISSGNAAGLMRIPRLDFIHRASELGISVLPVQRGRMVGGGRPRVANKREETRGQMSPEEIEEGVPRAAAGGRSHHCSKRRDVIHWFTPCTSLDVLTDGSVFHTANRTHRLSHFARWTLRCLDRR